MDHSRSCDPGLDDPLAVADTTLDAVGRTTDDDSSDDAPDGSRDDADPDHPDPDPDHADADPDDGDRDARLVGLDPESLRRLAATQPAIEQAKGMLMGYYGIDAEGAFALLSRWSSERHVKIRELARRVVDAASVPDPQPFGALRRLLEQDPSA